MDAMTLSISIGRLLIIWLLALVLICTCRFVLQRLRRRASQEGRPLLDAFFYALSRPLLIVILLEAVAYSTVVLDAKGGFELGRFYVPIHIFGWGVALMLFSSLLIHKGKRLWLGHLESTQVVDHRLRGTVNVIARLVQFLIIGILLLICLRAFGIDITGILAFGGIGGIILGLAAKDMLSNLFGSLILYLDQPFAIGDWILCRSAEIEGVVEKISWRSTHIRTFEKRLLYVPNSIFVNNTVENPSRMSHRRIYERIGLRYVDVGRVGEIVDAVRHLLQQHPEIDTTQTIIVNFDGFAPSSLDFFVYAYTRTTDWVKYHQVKQDVLLQIIDIIHEHGADCPFPTSSVILQKGEPGLEGPR